MKELKKFITPKGKPLSNIIQLSKKVHNPYLENHLKKVQTKKNVALDSLITLIYLSQLPLL
jgi:hypothetical protein